MNVNEKFSGIRKGLLEFLLLQIIAAEKVYVADILKQLARHGIRHPGGDALSAPEQDAARGPAGL